MSVRLVPRPAEPPPIEHIVWRVRKDTRIAQALILIHPHGRELRIMVGETLFWSRLYRDNEDSRELAEMATGCRQDFERFRLASRAANAIGSGKAVLDYILLGMASELIQPAREQAGIGRA